MELAFSSYRLKVSKEMFAWLRKPMRILRTIITKHTSALSYVTLYRHNGCKEYFLTLFMACVIFAWPHVSKTLMSSLMKPNPTTFNRTLMPSKYACVHQN